MRKPAEGGGGFYSPEAAWAAAANLPGWRQRLGRCPRRPHGKDFPPDPGSLARGLAAVLLAGTGPVLQCRVLSRAHLYQRCSVRFLGLGAVPARCCEQNTRWNRNSWQQSTTVVTCSDGYPRRSAFTRCMSMKWTRMMLTITSRWCLRGRNRPGTAHWGAVAARTLI